MIRQRLPAAMVLHSMAWLLDHLIVTRSRVHRSLCRRLCLCTVSGRVETDRNTRRVGSPQRCPSRRDFSQVNAVPASGFTFLPIPLLNTATNQNSMNKHSFLCFGKPRRS